MDAQTIKTALDASKGNVTRAALRLGVSRSTLRGWLEKTEPVTSPASRPAVGVGSTVAVRDSSGRVERYARVMDISGTEVRIEHRGLMAAFDRASLECLESEDGAMRGFVLVP